MAQAPVLTTAIAALSAFVTWKISQAVYRRHLVEVESQCNHLRTVIETTKVLDKAKPDLKAKIRTLSTLIDEGRTIRQQERADPAWRSEWEAWQVKVVEHLRREMEPQALTKFSDNTGLPQSVPMSWDYHGPRNPWFDRQIQNLIEIMENLEFYLP